jgi:hypothetical protein
MTMNKRVKIAILGLLGLSTAACCSTKKGNKSQDKREQEVDINQEDPRIMLMYGVPFPDGSVVRAVDENGNPIDEDVVAPNTGGVPFPDGSVAKPITEEEAARRIEELKKEGQDSLNVDIRPAVMYGVPFPDGSTVRPLREEQSGEESKTQE